MSKPPKPPVPQSQPNAPQKPERSLNFLEASAQDRKDLEANMKRYSCVLPEKISQAAREQGIREGVTVCGLTETALRDYIKRKEEERNQNN